MSILVVGGSGATGRLLLTELLDRGLAVKAIVRSPSALPAALREHPRLSLIQAELLALSDQELQGHVRGCSAIASCLGHTLSLKGIYGAPRRLVSEATRRLCQAVQAVQAPQPLRFVLMNTAGNRNRDLHEPVSWGQHCLLGMIRVLLPPHADNEAAADYLRLQIGQGDHAIAWAVVRPDTLINENAVSAYELHASPSRSAIFNAGTSSRNNVAHFMAELLTDARARAWQQWRGRMPVIYNQGFS